MSYFVINKSEDLSGVIKVQGAKNLILPLMAAALLSEGITIFDNCPDISDVRYTIKILEGFGCRVDFYDSTLSIDTRGFNPCNIGSKYSEKMRSSFLFMGALLSKCKTAKLSMPGGCNIGRRPIDIHLKAFREMGVKIAEDRDEIFADARYLRDAYIKLDFPSVGATENVILLAVKSNIHIVLDNIAREPEIKEMCNILNKMGAKICWESDSRIEIYGVDKLKPVRAKVMGDRICAGTYITAVGLCGGDVIISGIDNNSLLGMSDIFLRMGIEITNNSKDSIRVRCNRRTTNLTSIHTEPFPGFPTDVQSPLMVLASVSMGTVRLTENLFENRFRIVNELNRMGADIKVENNVAIINGVDSLRGTDVRATELRGGAALVLAGMVANGVTKITGIQYIARGYENILNDLNKIGGKIVCHME
ncbi:MAG: UDP-N-acetylglucosamine 1-carboxyvinyltransferase [Lachnospiraceae bacterium]|nr:UDP-N-acetylglucosamine 1-carboxyvinyltransferase [Lachnospiraceae bacterium]